VFIPKTPLLDTFVALFCTALLFFVMYKVIESSNRSRGPKPDREFEIYKRKPKKNNNIVVRNPAKFKQNPQIPQQVEGGDTIEARIEKAIGVEQTDPQLTPPKNETEFERKLREREEARMEMERVAREGALQEKEEEERRQQSRIDDYDYMLYQEFSLKITNKKGGKIKTEYIIKKICEKAGVPFLLETSRENVPHLRELQVDRFRVRKKTFHYALRMMSSSGGMSYRVSEQGVVLHRKK